MFARNLTAADLMTASPVTLSTEATVAEALARMRELSIHEVPVMDGKRLRGLVTLREIAQRTNLPLNARVSNLLVPSPRIRPNDSWETAARQLLLSGMRAAPVTGPGDRLLGIVSQTDIVRRLPGVVFLEGASAKEVMGPIGETVSERETIGSLVGRARDEPPLPVVDREGHLVGSIGLADLSRALWHPKSEGKGDLPREQGDRGTVRAIEARTIMRSPPVTVPEDAPVAEVVARMVAAGVSSVFVERDRSPVGVVTQDDLLEFATGGHPARGPRAEVYVRLHGLSGPSDPETLEEIDQAVAQGLARIRRRLPAVLLDLHFSPEGVHRAGHVTISARLQTPRGILHAHGTAWDLRTGLSQVLTQLERQTRVRAERSRRAARARVDLRHLRSRPAERFTGEAEPLPAV